jgi:hypothetical protein
MISSVVWYLQVRSEPTPVKHLSGAPLYGRLLVLTAINRLSWIGLPATNTLAYYRHFTDVKSFTTLGPVANVIKLFTAIIYEFS